MVEVFGSKDGNRKAGFFCGSSGDICSKGAWNITCMAAGNDVILLGTSKGWIIRHDFGVGDSYDIDLSTGRAGEQSIHRVFVDPGGSHCVATIVGGEGADTFYTHAKWTRPRVLRKPKGLVVNAVASTREVILGTDNGQLHEIAVDEKDKKEKHINFLFDLKELPEAFMGLQGRWTASTSNGTKYYMMAVTPTWLYSFSGIGSLDRTAFLYQVKKSCTFCMAFWSRYLSQWPKFWSTAHLPEGNENFVENKGLLDFSKLVDVAEAIKPNSLAVSEFHFLLLLGNKVKVVNRISEQIIEELQFDETPESMSRGISGLCSDASAGLFYAYDQNSIFQDVSVNDEGRDMWKVYLDLKEYAAVLANCRDPFQRDQVYLAQAEAAFSARDFLRAASFYAKIYYILSFEEITWKFISVNEQGSYVKVDELVYFASLKEQYEIVVHHYIHVLCQGEAKKALEVLQKPAVPIDLQYKFSPHLIMLDAYETVESWMTTKRLNPRKLILAMMRYSSEPHAK
ncbi:unnamed protein product [Camellia sinensis]